MFSKKKKYLCLTFGQGGWANSVDPDQIAPKGAVWSGSTLFAILSVLVDTSKDNQTDLVKFYVNYVRSPNIFDNYSILHKKKSQKSQKKKKKKKKKKESLPTLPIFSNMLP